MLSGFWTPLEKCVVTMFTKAAVSLINLNVFLLLWHGAVLSVDLLANATTKALVPVLSLLVHAVMEMMQKLQLAAINLGQVKRERERSCLYFQCVSSASVAVVFDLCDPDLEVLQVLYISGVVAISLTSL